MSRPKIYEVHFNNGNVVSMDKCEFYAFFHSHIGADYYVVCKNKVYDLRKR